METRKFIELDYFDWCEQYKPVRNTIGSIPSFNGCMFETYGAEYDAVRAADPARVWTYIDGDNGGTYIVNGWHYVNRIGYFITELPFDDSAADCEIEVGEPDPIYAFFCEMKGAALPYGIEYSDDIEGDDIYSVEWYATKEERDEIIKNGNYIMPREEKIYG